MNADRRQVDLDDSGPQDLDGQSSNTQDQEDLQTGETDAVDPGMSDTLDVPLDDVENQAAETAAAVGDVDTGENQVVVVHQHDKAKTFEFASEESIEIIRKHPVSRMMGKLLDPDQELTEDRIKRFEELVWGMNVEAMRRPDNDEVVKELHKLRLVLDHNRYVAERFGDRYRELVNFLTEKLHEIDQATPTFQEGLEKCTTAPEILNSIADKGLMAMDPAIRSNTIESIERDIRKLRTGISERFRLGVGVKGSPDDRQKAFSAILNELRAEARGYNIALMRIAVKLEQHVEDPQHASNPYINDIYALVGHLETSAFELVDIYYNRAKRRSRSENYYKAFFASAQCVISLILQARKVSTWQRENLKELGVDAEVEARMKRKYGLEPFDEAVARFENGEKSSIRRIARKLVRQSYKKQRASAIFDLDHCLKEFANVIDSTSELGGHDPETVEELERAAELVRNELDERQNPRPWISRKLRKAKEFVEDSGGWLRDGVGRMGRWFKRSYKKAKTVVGNGLRRGWNWMKGMGKRFWEFLKENKWRFAAAATLLSIGTGVLSVHNGKDHQDYMKDWKKEGMEGAFSPGGDGDGEELAGNMMSRKQGIIDEFVGGFDDGPDPGPDPDLDPEDDSEVDSDSDTDSDLDLDSEQSVEPEVDEKSDQDSENDLNPEVEPESLNSITHSMSLAAMQAILDSEGRAAAPSIPKIPNIDYTSVDGDSYWEVGKKLFGGPAWEGEFKNNWRTTIMAAIIATHSEAEFDAILVGDMELDIRRVVDALDNRIDPLRDGQQFKADSEKVKKLNKLCSEGGQYRTVWKIHEAEEALKLVQDDVVDDGDGSGGGVGEDGNDGEGLVAVDNISEEINQGWLEMMEEGNFNS